MKFRSLPLVVCLFALFACGTSNAFAQGALYLAPTAVRATGTADNSVFAFLGQGKTSEMLYGVTFGGYYDFPQHGVKQETGLEIGIDVRDSILHGNNALVSSFLVGPRIAIALSPRLHPFVVPAVGVGSTRAPNTAIKVNKVQFGVFGGLDFNLNRRINFRVVEVGYSSLKAASGETVGGTESVPAVRLLSVTTGFTFRLP